MDRKHIILRLFYLRNWEFFNIFLLPACLAIIITSLRLPTWVLYSYSLLLVCQILAQGTFYWHLKLCTIRTSIGRLPSYFHSTFRLFKRINVVLISFYPLLFVYMLSKGQSQAEEPVWATALWAFAILEHINYYHYQLMHDNANDIQYLMRYKKLRPAPIATDLARTVVAVREL